MPNEPKQSNICEVYRMNPDGSKGEHLRTDPAFPEGWDNPTKILPQKPRPKEEESMVKPRDDKAEKMAEAKKLIAEGKSVMGAAKMIGIPQSTLVTWLAKEKDAPVSGFTPETPVANQETPEQEPETGCPFDEPIFNPEPPTKQAPDPLAAELTKLKLDFTNLVLSSALGDTMKLKVIEYIVRM